VKFVWAEAGELILDENGKAAVVMGIVQDITERKLTQMKIQTQNEELKKLNSDKDRFMSILAHDLKNPFNAILGFLELLSTNVRNYEIGVIEQQINIVFQSALHVYELLDDILNWARAQAGKLPFNPKQINFEEICADVFDLLSENSNAKQITTNFAQGNTVEIFADKNMLKAILRNLVSNAIKFTPKGGQIDVFATNLENEIQITVADNGVGIDGEKLKRLFDKTQVVTTPGTEKENGTGLGLLLCQEFVGMHHGKIWIESKLGLGSKIIFTIPNHKI
jgi:signal transduction histidine kinase